MFSNAIEVSYLDIGHVLFGNWQHPLPFGITVNYTVLSVPLYFNTVQIEDE